MSSVRLLVCTFHRETIGKILIVDTLPSWSRIEEQSERFPTEVESLTLDGYLSTCKAKRLNMSCTIFNIQTCCINLLVHLCFDTDERVLVRTVNINSKLI